MVRQIKKNNWLYPRSRLIVRKEKHFLPYSINQFAIFSGFNKMKLHVKANDRNSILKYNLVKPLDAATKLIFINGKKNRQAT